MFDDQRVELLINYQRELRMMLIECDELTQKGMGEIYGRYLKVCGEIERILIPPTSDQ